MYQNILRVALLLVSTMLLWACEEEKKATNTTATPATKSSEAPNATTITTSAAEQKTTSTPAGTPPKLNPPHGQPFHKCEIPVGAPLDGSAAAPNNMTTPAAAAPKSFFKTAQATETAAPQMAPTTQQLPPKPVQNATADVGTKPKLNPAHGQPFHRCDIAVGAPLP